MARSDARGCGLSLATDAYFHMATRRCMLGRSSALEPKFVD